MAPPKKTKNSVAHESRTSIIDAVRTPLGFFVLVVLVIEALVGGLGISLPPEQRFNVIFLMLSLAVGLVTTIALIAHFNPEALYGRRSITKEPEITRDEAIAKAERFAQEVCTHLPTVL